MLNSSFAGALLNVLDGLNLPSESDPQAPRYKEWQHFCVLDEANGLHALFNLNVAGPREGTSPGFWLPPLNESTAGPAICLLVAKVK